MANFEKLIIPSSQPDLAAYCPEKAAVLLFCFSRIESFSLEED